ncbi:MAG: NUDIX hydrolase [Ignavibacteriales bacterium]|nr:NUDIX hydrolase [Ignavibacteriales bacterium]
MTHVKTLKSEKRYSGTIFSLLVDDVEYLSGRRGVREVAEHPGGAVVVPLLDDGTVLLVHQYRYPIKTELLELPAGKLDPGEDPQLCAMRELEEETGYIAGSIRKLTAIYTTPGFCNELLHIYLAMGLKKSPHGQRLEEGEMDLVVKPFHLDDVVNMIERGEIVDGKTICGIMMTAQLLRAGTIHITDPAR